MERERLPVVPETPLRRVNVEVFDKGAQAESRMTPALLALLATVRSLFRRRAALHAEVLALRHQLLVLERPVAGRRVQLRTSDRLLWAHLALGKDAPKPRAVYERELGEVVAFPELRGLHHRYERRAA